MNRLGGSPEVVGRKVLVNNYPMTVVGVAPAGFPGVDPLAPPMLWVPAAMTEQAANIDAYWDRLLDRRAAWLNVLGRLKPGLTAGTGEGRPPAMVQLDARGRRAPRRLSTSDCRTAHQLSCVDGRHSPRAWRPVEPARRARAAALGS